MKKIFLILLPIIFSCSLFKSGNKNIGCIENDKFKKEFFIQVEYVKKNISVSQNKKFIESLIFIANYAPVTFEEMMNYGRTYGIKTLEKDEKEWLKWYQENKCKNIQLKNNYPVPEQYKEFFNY